MISNHTMPGLPKQEIRMIWGRFLCYWMAIIALVVRGANDPRIIDIDAELSQASAAKKPITVLLVDPGNSVDDRNLLSYFKWSADKLHQMGSRTLIIDVSLSRNRATATRYHLFNTPVIVCLTPRGLVFSQDARPGFHKILPERVENLVAGWAELDGRLAQLEHGLERDTDKIHAHMRLAEFLEAQDNKREAIPHFEAVAHEFGADLNERVKAWETLARCHFWVAEPEKGRHEATDLISTLGPKTPDAIAAGNYDLGLQDYVAKRYSRAREEFDAAVAASPDSEYGKKAKNLLQSAASIGG